MSTLNLVDTAKPSRVGPRLDRTTFHTSRLLDFCSKKELVAQTGHDVDQWPLVVLKELLDNAIDACEEAIPAVAPVISVSVTDEGLAIEDNGPGIPNGTIQGVLDYSIRVSSREAYVSPTRGAQGNALKTILAMPFVLDGESGVVEIGTRGVMHRIEFKVDRIRQQPDIAHKTSPDANCKDRTRILIRWPSSASSILRDSETRFLQIADAFCWANPHLTLTLDWFGSRLLTCEASSPTWKKWRPSDPTSAYWYEDEHLKRLIAGYITHDLDREDSPHRTVREFVGEFRGLSGSAKQKLVTDATGLSRTSLVDLVCDDDIDAQVVSKLRNAMQEHSRPVKPMDLGLIGKDHLRFRCEAAGCDAATFSYAVVKGEADGLPYLIETAFAAFGCALDQSKPHRDRNFIGGVNWSACILNPFRKVGSHSLDGFLSGQHCGEREPVLFFVHFVCPRVQHTDRGKSALSVPDSIGEELIEAVEKVTRKWHKQRKQEDREAKRRSNRRDTYYRSIKKKIKAAAFESARDAYMKASGNGELPAHARQVMYAARDYIQGTTGEVLDDDYYTQQLLPAYIRDNPHETKDWDVVFDARGHLWEPHTNLELPVGTLDVREYLKGCQHGVPTSIADLVVDANFDTYGPANRYGAILFIEKEGFMPLFRKIKLAERYDIAIMSTKGMPTTACRLLVDDLCNHRGVPLLALHDFDKSGLSILGTLHKDNQRYEFTNQVNIIDLGIRLNDVRRHGLIGEDVSYKGDPRKNLRINGASEEEMEFLCSRGDKYTQYGGRRVELNEFTSAQFVEWIEGKLNRHGIKKVVPDADALAKAYRHAASVHFLNHRISEAREDAMRHGDAVAIPDSLEQRLRDCLKANPERSWDSVVADLAREAA